MIDSIAIDITNYCNFDCIHCVRDKLSPRAHMRPELLEKVLQEISSIGIKATALTGGEPALHPRLEKIFRLHAQYGIVFSFVSNGYFFEEKIFPLLDSPAGEMLTDVCFSLDGGTARSHDRIRGQEGSFKKVIKSIKMCVNEGFPVSIKSIVHKDNIGELNDIAFLCASMDVKNLGFIILTPTPRLLSNNLMPTPTEYSEVVNHIKSTMIPAFSMKIEIEGYSDPEFKVPFCNPSRGISMDHEGNFIFCCNLSHPTAGNRPDEFGREFLGNIEEIGIEEGVLRHYRMFGSFMEEVIRSGRSEFSGSECAGCFRRFGKMDWIKDYESPHHRNC